MKYTQIPTNTFEELQLNAGVMLSEFTPASGEFEPTNILGATTGGISFTDVPEYVDWGEDIDNCPKNTKELKHINSREIKMAGTYLTADTEQAKSLIASADINGLDPTKLDIRDTLKDTDFKDIWWVGDYSDKNGKANGGFIAIHLKNALNTAGFSLQTADKEKGQFAFEYTAHYSLADIDTVPYEMYVKAGEPEA